MYTKVLGRSAEAVGITAWTEFLNAGTATGAACASSFINSAEFKAKDLSDEDYIKVLYQAVMGREVENDDALNLWTGILATGVSRDYVLASFVNNAAEFAQICTEYGMQAGSLDLTENRDQNIKVTEFVQRFYTKVLERSAEVEGLNVWTGEIINGNETPVSAAYKFVFSDEQKAMYRDDESFIRMLYRTFLGREVEDEKTLNVWLNELNSKGRENVFYTLSGGTEFADIVASYGL
jgi:hypothetical protein